MLLERDPPTNWHEIILDFIRWRWKLTTIAATLNIPESTLKGWWYDGHEPRFSDGQALLKLHRIEKDRRKSDDAALKSGASSASHAHDQPRKETDMAKKGPKAVRTPGNAAQPAQPGGKSDPDAAINAARAGGTHKVAKPRPSVPASKVKGDPDRPQVAPVNAKAESKYDQAMADRAAGKLVRSVLTEQGWVTPLPAPVPAGAKA